MSENKNVGGFGRQNGRGGQPAEPTMSANLDYLKAQLSTEEQFLENAIRSEKFIKKHLTKFIVVLLVVVGAAVYFGVQESSERARLHRANDAYNALLANASDEGARAILRENNANLFGLFALRSGNLAWMNEALTLGIDPLLREVLLVGTGQKSGELMGNFDAFMSGYDALVAGNSAAASAAFGRIAPTSELKNLSKKLLHYGGGANSGGSVNSGGGAGFGAGGGMNAGGGALQFKPASAGGANPGAK